MSITKNSYDKLFLQGYILYMSETRDKPQSQIDTASVLQDIPPFQDGLTIVSTPNYQLVYGYKPGLEQQPNGQRSFLVPTNRVAEAVLVQFANDNHNALTNRPYGEGGAETISSVRYNGSVRDLLEFLLDSEDNPAFLGSGVPSLKSLEERVATAKQQQTS